MYFQELSIAGAFLAAGTAQAGDLMVEVSVPAQRKGMVLAALFDKADGFPWGQALRTASVQPVQGKATVQFTGLPEGNYAFTAFLDENGNARLDTNVFGIPTEPYGFSRNARRPMTPPPFADAAFRVEGGMQQQSVELK